MNRTLKLLTTFLAAGAVFAGDAAAASSPAVSTGGTSSRTSSSAVLHATVNPNGAATQYVFEWGLTNTYGLSSTAKSAGSGTKSVSVQVTAGHLIPGTRYHYRVIASNRFGGTSGVDQSFRTAGHAPPGVATGPATQLGKSIATLTGSVNPNGEATSWVFQYGLTASYFANTFGGTLPASSAPSIVAQQLQGLKPGTVFHFRLIALHGGTVVSYGADQSFMTFPLPRPLPRVRAATNPRHDSSKPYVFTTAATVLRPASIPASLGCAGDATIRYMLGHRQVGSTVVLLQPNCTFTGQVTFRNLPGKGSKSRQVRLRVLIHFGGNGYLAPRDAAAESVLLG
jgi:hypothetical protein